MRRPIAVLFVLALGACSDGGKNASEPPTVPPLRTDAGETPTALTPDPKSDLYTTSGVAGVVTAGPTCPVERPESPCPDKEVTDATVTAKDRDGKLVRRARTDENGEYTLTLEPGFYEIGAASRSVQACMTVNVVVKKERYTQAPITCDTGIR